LEVIVTEFEPEFSKRTLAPAAPAKITTPCIPEAVTGEPTVCHVVPSGPSTWSVTLGDVPERM
jgi:hypothetical protein